jgi:ribonucleoside-diphosphate reductase beta chain
MSDIKNTNNDEWLLSKNESRFAIYPIQHLDIWEAYKQQQAAFWTVDEVDLSKDKSDWESLNDNEKHFIEYVLAFFAQSDGLVNLNLLENFTQEVTVPEAQFVYTYQAMMENIHAEMYALMIDTYIKDAEKQKILLNAIENIPCITKKATWVMKWIESDDSFAKRLIAFAIVEGIFFSGSFCAIYWLKERNLMPGLTMSNEFIARDEGMHTDFACLLYSKIKNRVDEETVHNIFSDAVDIEIEFITESLPCNLIGMNSILMSQYIKYVADRLLQQLSYKKLYNETNPFGFMEKIGLDNKTNFFEKRVSEYKKAGVMSSDKGNNFEISDDF